MSSTRYLIAEVKYRAISGRNEVPVGYVDYEFDVAGAIAGLKKLNPGAEYVSIPIPCVHRTVIENKVNT